MQNVELSQLSIARAESDADLEDMVGVRNRVTPEARPTLENLRFNLEAKPELAHVVARLAGEPVACGFAEPWTSRAVGDGAVVPQRRRRGIRPAVLADPWAGAGTQG